jgi:hypothetical protein
MNDAAIIHLPAQSQPEPKKKRSGSQNRQRRNLEWFRTDDAEHAALHEKVRASGKSLGAYVMQLAAIDATDEARARRRSHPTVEAEALLQAVAAFNRQHSNYNQAVKALNTLALVADERDSDRLADKVDVLRAALARMQEQFAAPFAAILEAVHGVREG